MVQDGGVVFVWRGFRVLLVSFGVFNLTILVWSICLFFFADFRMIFGKVLVCWFLSVLYGLEHRKL